MKILTLNYEFPPVGGGAAPVSLELCRRLAATGHQVDVITMRYKDLPRFEDIDGVGIYRTPALRRRPDICRPHEMLTYPLGALRKANRLAKEKKYDIVHAHFIIPTAPLGCWLAGRNKIPLVITCHGSDVPGYNPDRFKLLHRILSPAWWFLVKKANALVCPSGYLKALITEKYPDAPVQVIPNGLALDILPVQDIAQKTRQILLCSRLLPRKGFQYLIKAVSDIELDWQVNIVGDGPYRQILQQLACESKTPIRFWGWLDRNDSQFKKLYRTSSIFVFPSEAENFPTVLLEALASGMAIITSSAGGCPEVVGGAAVLVEPANTEQLKEKLLALVQNEQLRNSLSAAAIERAKEFTWPGIAGRYAKLFEKLVEENKKTR